MLHGLLRTGLIGLLLAVSGAGGAHAQSLQGRIVDGETDAPIAAARVVVRASGDAYRTDSDADGRFRLQVRRAGEHLVEVSHVDYLDMRTLTVTIPAGGIAEVVIRLSRTVVQGDTLIVVATARDQFHEATFEGAMLRRDRFPNYGFRRVLTQTDPELSSSGQVSDVLRFMPAGRCTRIWYDGRYERETEADLSSLNLPASFFEAVEFYRTSSDAPQAYRTEPGAGRCSILALWSRRTPTQTTRPLLRLVGTVAASALLVMLLR